MCYFVYILHSLSNDSFYIGQTADLDDRIHRHNSGYEKATKSAIPWILVWYTTKNSRSHALILEKKLKNYSKKRIVDFIIRHKAVVAGPDDTGDPGMSGC